MTPVYNFTFKGVDANTTHGIVTMEIASEVIAERRDSTTVVAGRSGLVHDQDGAVEEVERRLKLYLPYEQVSTVSNFAAIRKWLKGYGELTLSTLPNRYMMAYVTDEIDFDPLVQGFADLEGSVIFRCEPYLYHTGVQDIVLKANATVSNPGTAAAAPKITVNATGTVDLMIGSQTVLLTDLTGQIILDCRAEEAYGLDSGGKLVNLNNLMSGDFPQLVPGSNGVSWALHTGAALGTGGIVITPSWRDEN